MTISEKKRLAHQALRRADLNVQKIWRELHDLEGYFEDRHDWLSADKIALIRRNCRMEYASILDVDCTWSARLLGVQRTVRAYLDAVQTVNQCEAFWLIKNRRIT